MVGYDNSDVLTLADSPGSQRIKGEIDRGQKCYGLNNPITHYNPYSFSPGEVIVIDFKERYFKMSSMGPIDELGKERVKYSVLNHVKHVLGDNDITLEDIFTYCVREEMKDFNLENVPFQETMRHIEYLKDIKEEERKEKMEEVEKQKKEIQKVMLDSIAYQNTCEMYGIEHLELSHDQVKLLEKYLEKIKQL
jgi:hypothetical protein